MKKIFLVAGFFILTSTPQSFAKDIQQDTLPNKTMLRCNKLCDTDLRLPFFHWRQMQMGTLLVDRTIVDLRFRSHQSDYTSECHLSWWPQAIQLNSNRGLLPDLHLADIFLELYKSRLLNQGISPPRN